ncbi:MAG: phospholipase D-like domain-containing protein [Candidatus Bathyarchaeia archaeon]
MSSTSDNETNSVVLKSDGSSVPYNQAIKDLIESTKKEIIIISPFLSVDILKDFDRLDEPNAPAVRIVVCSSYAGEEGAGHIYTKQLDPNILMSYNERGFEIRKNCNLHSKIIISDGKSAIVGSANLSSAAFSPDRWETGISRESNGVQQSFLYDYAKRLVRQSKLVRKREIKRWLEVLEEHKSKIEKMKIIQQELDKDLSNKLKRERNRAKGKGEALMLFADEEQIENALRERRKGFTALIKQASLRYKFPDCDYHLDILLDEMGRIPVWLYSRDRQEVVATGFIVYAAYNQIETLLRSLAHMGYYGISNNVWPIDSGFSEVSALDHRNIHVLVIIEELKKLHRPITLARLKRQGLENPNVGPGGRYVPMKIFKRIQ